MAQYEHLPIYKKAFELSLFLENEVKNFSRYHKYTLGSELRDKSRRAAILIIRANSRTDKLGILLELRAGYNGFGGGWNVGWVERLQLLGFAAELYQTNR